MKIEIKTETKNKALMPCKRKKKKLLTINKICRMNNDLA
jgi:hypothetical protein